MDMRGIPPKPATVETTSTEPSRDLIYGAEAVDDGKFPMTIRTTLSKRELCKPLDDNRVSKEPPSECRNTVNKTTKFWGSFEEYKRESGLA